MQSDISPSLIERFARFGIIASVAFCIDFSSLYLLSRIVGLALLEARLISLPLAATAAWYGNRRTTFSDRASHPKGRQWVHYVTVNLASGVFNYGIYALVVSLSTWMAHHPPLAIAPGAFCAMLINFACANFWIFNSKEPDG